MNAVESPLCLPQANGMCLEARPVTSGGRRVYTDFASGEWLEKMQAIAPYLLNAAETVIFSAPKSLSNCWWRHLQASMRASIHPGAHTLGLLFYSDAAEARRFQHKFHPLSLYIANFTLNGIRSQRGFRRVAHLPVLQKEDFPKLTPKQ